MVRNDPGIDEQENVKISGPVRGFFISGWNNLVRLMAANTLFVIFNIPSSAIAFVISFVFVPVYMPLFIDMGPYQELNSGSEAVLELFILLMIFMVNMLLSSTLICTGPFQAGFTEVYKDIRNNTSVSFFTSFKAGLKNNWKKGLASMLISFAVTPVLLLAISFYLNMKTSLGTVTGVFFIVLLLAFILIQNFVYSLIVSTDLKLGKIYKNAVLFIFLRFVPCLGAALTVLLVYFVIPFILLASASYVTLGIFMFLYSFVAISWTQYFLACFTGSLIDRYVKSDAEE